MFYIVIAIIFIVLVVAVFVGAAVLDGYRTVKQTPRVNAFTCPKHGPIAPDEVITFVDVPACGICWWETFKAAGEGTGPFA